ncbi:DUF975 family protein [Candidatus Enterococcus clewellii]|uniref:Integral membrane protein n=1 Tax=Candidatus Enterococcus clewellii TaxID=1834193 RepID=A0A242K7I2_9ENTE|nr:DUF975 family protein [Enterococcus sp. 9E7_DIV0242]OTP15657.1 hypothetical protein A5888_001871 [Enterococcus sp. 9E7_DIV0242]
MNNQMTNAMHRERARKALSGKWGTMALIVLVSVLIETVVSTLVGNTTGVAGDSTGGRFISFVLSNLIFFALTYGLYNAALQVIRGRSIEVGMVLSIFKGEYYVPMLLINLVQYFVQLLANLIFLLPVLITYGATIYFGMMFNTVSITQYQNEMASDVIFALFLFAFSILLLLLSLFISGVFQFAVWTKIDHPDWGVGTSLKYALDLMKGRFKQYVFLELSFVGWYIVGALAIGIGLLWVIPYNHVALASFYDEARDEKDLSI